MKQFAISFLVSFSLAAANQTSSVSPVLTEDSLPYSVELQEADFTLPAGIQAFAVGQQKGYWVFITGRTAGLHSFGGTGNNFPPSEQNRIVYVVDANSGNSFSRSLEDPTAGLTTEEVDTLSVIAPQFFQKGPLLYVVGGYGINRLTGEMETKSTLTEINLSKLIQWVQSGKPSAKEALRQVSHPQLQVTGGALYQLNDHTPFLLMLGQNFQGFYHDGSNGIYTQQIRTFWLSRNSNEICFLAQPSNDTFTNYRRRDLNILPIQTASGPSYRAFSGLFTPTMGAWTLPIEIEPDGSSTQADVNLPSTFKQAMNNYNCASFSLYSRSRKESYSLFFGGISFGFFSGGSFQTDSSFPFINQITTVRIQEGGETSQHLMSEQFPVILSTGSNPGNPLLFGAEAVFLPHPDAPFMPNGVLSLDHLPGSAVEVGSIVGGIMSTVPNTSSASDSTVSPHVFRVLIKRK